MTTFHILHIVLMLDKHSSPAQRLVEDDSSYHRTTSSEILFGGMLDCDADTLPELLGGFWYIFK